MRIFFSERLLEFFKANTAKGFQFNNPVRIFWQAPWSGFDDLSRTLVQLAYQSRYRDLFTYCPNVHNSCKSFDQWYSHRIKCNDSCLQLGGNFTREIWITKNTTNGHYIHVTVSLKGQKNWISCKSLVPKTFIQCNACD